MKFEDVQKLAEKYSNNLREKNIVSIVQVGSSLRKQEFMGNSDLDLLVIYKNSVRKTLTVKYEEGIEVNLIRRGKSQFAKSLVEGSTVDLIAAKFGKILADDGFFRNMVKKSFKPTEKTVEIWMSTASFNLMEGANNYPFPTCMCCYFKALHHAARDYLRAIILKEKSKLIEGDRKIVKIVSDIYPKLVKKYELILAGRKNFDKYDVKHRTVTRIKEDKLGKFLLAAEQIASKAFEVVLYMKLPRVNDLVSELAEKYKIDHLLGFSLSPERKELTIDVVLKNDKVELFTYDLEKSVWKI